MTNSSDILAALPPERLVKALELIDYMLGPALKVGDADVVLTQMSERMRDGGMPLDRATSIVPLLHAEAGASARFWERGKGARSYSFPFVAEGSLKYGASPAAVAHKTRDWVVLWLPDTPDEKFDIVKELKDAGLTHYVMIPVFMANGMSSTFSFATKAETGFSEMDFAFLRAVFPALAACQEILTTHRVMNDVLRMYVGADAQKRILSGDVHRGEVMRIRSAILFADMRNYTKLSNAMQAEDVTAMLNNYFDCIVPEIEQRGGEVLKYMGDGILAIFRKQADAKTTCKRALEAACAALKAVRDFDGVPQFKAGVALHYGEVGYGNIGSGMRLDYTVVGQDVNKAARLEGLCGPLAEPLLVSDIFRDLVGADQFRVVGTHELKGLTGTHEVLAPI